MADHADDALMPDGQRYSWEPQPGPQYDLVRCPVFEVFYGGARGGGKTDGVLGEFINHADKYGEHAIALMVRRTRTELVETIERSKAIYGLMGAVYHTQESMWRFPNGARLRFAYLERDDDANAYQGHSYTRVYVEEIGNFPSATPILKLMATLRSGAGVPCGFRATGNPGGPGHQWVKARYIDPAPLGWKVITSTFGEGVSRDRVYIPSRLADNRYLGKEYEANLHMSGNEQLVRAWLEGDWNVIAGAFFPEFGPSHILSARSLPAAWPRFRSADWGSARPFSIGWWAISDGSLPDLPRGSLVRYREWYGWNGQPNEGSKLTAEAVGAGIAEREEGETVSNGASVMDPAAFSSDGGPSIVERIYTGSSKRVNFRRADNRRVATKGPMAGWDQVRARLKGEDGRPMIYFFETCTHLIRTLPALQHDEARPEDVDTEGEDHAPDECFVAGTMVDTRTGPWPIEAIVPGKHEIWSGGKWRWMIDARLTKFDADVVRLTFDDGRAVTCTPNHQFMDHSGEWRYASDLLGVSVACDQSSSVQRFKSLKVGGSIAVDSTFRERALGFIAACGKLISDRSPMVGTSTIRMKIDRTMIQTIWSVWKGQSIWARAMARRVAHERVMLSQGRVLPPLNGTDLMLAENGIASILTGTLGPLWISEFRQHVGSAAKAISSRLFASLKANSVAITVKPVRCVSVEKMPRATVYCITEPVTEAFTIEGGLIVHNCRYACMSRPYLRKDIPKKEPVFPGMAIGSVSRPGFVTPPTMDRLWKDHERGMHND